MCLSLFKMTMQGVHSLPPLAELHCPACCHLNTTLLYIGFSQRFTRI